MAEAVDVKVGGCAGVELFVLVGGGVFVAVGTGVNVAVFTAVELGVNVDVWGGKGVALPVCVGVEMEVE